MFPHWGGNAGRDKFQEKKSLWVSEKPPQGPWKPRNSISPSEWIPLQRSRAQTGPSVQTLGALNWGILALEMHRRHHRTFLRKKLLVLQIGGSSSFYTCIHFQDKRAWVQMQQNPNSLDNPKLHLQRKPSVTGNYNSHHMPQRGQRGCFISTWEQGEGRWLCAHT